MTDANDSAYPLLRRIGTATADLPGLTKREAFALEAMKCRLTNVQMYERHGCQYENVADDAVRWADALIRRLNSETPEPIMSINKETTI